MPSASLDNDISKLSIDKSRRRRGGRGGGLGRVPTLLIASIVLVAGGYFAYTKLNTPGIQVSVVQPTRESASSTPSGQAVLTASGYVIARDVYVISTKVDGRVKDIFIERGQLVKAGDTIITIEDDEFRARVALAEAQVAKAQANLDQLKAGSRPEEIARARAQAAAAKATAVQAKREEDRIAGLAKQGISSTNEMDQATANRKVADANYNALAELASLAEIGPRQEEIQMAEAALQESKANLDYARTQLSYTVINAPITGTILEKVAKKGEMLTSQNFGGTTQGARSSAVSMADLTDLQVELDINEDDLPRVRLKQKCEVRVDSHPDQVIPGEVDEIAPKADRQKATVQVKVKIVNPPDFLRPDVNARVTFLEEAPKEPVKQDGLATLWVPRNVVVLGPDGSSVYIAFEGKAMIRKVTTGREGALGVEITDGLVGDEQLVASNLDQIKDGARIAVSSQK